MNQRSRYCLLLAIREERDAASLWNVVDIISTTDTEQCPRNSFISRCHTLLPETFRSKQSKVIPVHF